MQISLIRLCRTLFAGVVLAAIAGCSGGDNADIGRDGVGNPGQVPLANLEAVPFPGDLDDEPGIRHTSATADFPRDGEDSWRSTDNTAINNTSRDFNAGFGELSWAIYRFSGLSDWHDLNRVVADWAGLPDTYYVGLPDFHNQKWHWITAGSSHGSLADEDFIDWPDGVDGISDAGNCYCAIVFFDGYSATLDTITLNWETDHNGPTAAFEVDRDSGDASLTVNFDASGSFDEDGPGIDEYAWDFEGDGIIDEIKAVPSTQHTYIARGQYTPTLRVTDQDDGLTDVATDLIDVVGWIHSYGSNNFEAAYEAIPMQDDVFIVGDVYYASGNHRDGLIQSYSPYGEPRWKKYWGMSGQDESFVDGAQIYGSGFVAVGNTSGFGVEGRAMLIVRFNRYGEVMWVRTWDTSGNDYARGVTVDFAGDIVVCGFTNGLDIDEEIDGILLKLDPDGNFIFERSMSNDGDVYARCIALDLLGNYFVGGASDGYDIGTGSAAIWKFSPDGTVEWEKALNGPEEATAHAISVSILGSIYIAGSSWDGLDQAFVAGADSVGQFSWAAGWDYGTSSQANGLQLKHSGFALNELFVSVSTYHQEQTKSQACLLNFEPDGDYLGTTGWSSTGGNSLTGIAGGVSGTSVVCGSGDAAAATRSSINHDPVPYIGIFTYLGDGIIATVNATKGSPSLNSVDYEGVLDTGGGNIDSWVTCFDADDL